LLEREGEEPAAVDVHRLIPAKRTHPDFSIRLIEILNSTFDPKWL